MFRKMLGGDERGRLVERGVHVTHHPRLPKEVAVTTRFEIGRGTQPWGRDRQRLGAELLDRHIFFWNRLTKLRFANRLSRRTDRQRKRQPAGRSVRAGESQSRQALIR